MQKYCALITDQDKRILLDIFKDKIEQGRRAIATDYKTYIVGGPVVNLKLNGEMCYKPQTTDIHVGGPIVNQKLKWGDVLLATDYKIYFVGGPIVNL